MARRSKVSPKVLVWQWPNGARWCIRIDAGTFVFIALYKEQPSRARPWPQQIEVYSVRRGLETFMGYAAGQVHARLAACFVDLLDNRLLATLNPGLTVGHECGPMVLTGLEELAWMHRHHVPVRVHFGRDG